MWKLSKTLCILPWISFDRAVYHKNDFRIAPCCQFKYHKDNPLSFDEYINSNELSKTRQQMINGEWPSGCLSCKKLEDSKKLSLRQSVNSSRLTQYQHFIDNQFHLKQVKLNLGNQCNLSCRMCLPEWSTGVKKTYEKINFDISNVLHYDVLADEIIKNNRNIEYIDVLGGEPFYNKKFLNLLEYLIKDNRTEITLFITTNATVLNKNIIDKLRMFKKVIISVSIDAINELYNYIRVGADFNSVEKNIHLLASNFDTVIASTVSALNITRLHEVDQWATKNQIHQIQKTVVENPYQLNPEIVPFEMKKHIHKDYHCFVSQSGQIKDFFKFVKLLDTAHKTDYKKVLPEWNEYEGSFGI